jgi:YjbE family integral membrane protein
MTDILSGFYANAEPQFWMAVVEIIWINVLLSGDNAIVIALACRSLPPRQRLIGMVLGTAAAMVMRLAFAGIVSTLMFIPYLKIAGGVALLWIATRLLVPAKESGEAAMPAGNLLHAMKVIAIADVVMSLDNVIAVVAAADGNFALLAFGLGISIPVIIAGATVIMAMLNYFPIIAWAGAALLGWIGGELIATDPVIVEYAGSFGPAHHEYVKLTCSIAGGVGALMAGIFVRTRQSRYVEGKQLPGR